MITLTNPDRDYRNGDYLNDPKIQKLFDDFLNRGRSIVDMLSVLKEIEELCEDKIREKTDTISVLWVREKLQEAYDKQKNMGSIGICYCGNLMDKIDNGWECKNHNYL